MIEGIVIPLITVSLAELGDKSQLTVLTLASKTKNYIALLVGIMLAFAVVDGVAILFGDWITVFIPISILKILSGILFIYFGILSIREKQEAENVKVHKTKKGIFISGFTLIFLSEWGDKTQLSAALFATKYNPVLVFVGVMLGLLFLTILAIFVGKFIFSKINKKALSLTSGIVFILLGLSFMILR